MQAVFLTFEDKCNKRDVIHDYLKENVCIDQACKKPEQEIKGSCIDCKKRKKKKKFKRPKVFRKKLKNRVFKNEMFGKKRRMKF